MNPQRRLGTESAKNRALLIEAAERLLSAEGYVAITARKVAAKAGLKLPLVYYYFKTMDDLILEVARKNTAKRLKRFVRALTSPEPLRALWELSSDHTTTPFPPPKYWRSPIIGNRYAPKWWPPPSSFARCRSRPSTGC